MTNAPCSHPQAVRIFDAAGMRCPDCREVLIPADPDGVTRFMYPMRASRSSPSPSPAPPPGSSEGESPDPRGDGSYEWAYGTSVDILQSALDGLPEAEADLPMPRMARRAAAAITRLRSPPSAADATRDEVKRLTKKLDAALSERDHIVGSLHSELERLRAKRRDDRAAEATLRERVEALEAALRAIRDHEAPQEAIGLRNEDCEECKRRTEQKWPPSGLCERHYGEMASLRDRNEQARAHQHYEMRNIARSVLLASSPPRDHEAPPTNYPANDWCGDPNCRGGCGCTQTGVCKCPSPAGRDGRETP